MGSSPKPSRSCGWSSSAANAPGRHRCSELRNVVNWKQQQIDLLTGETAAGASDALDASGLSGGVLGGGTPSPLPGRGSNSASGGNKQHQHQFFSHKSVGSAASASVGRVRQGSTDEKKVFDSDLKPKEEEVSSVAAAHPAPHGHSSTD